MTAPRAATRRKAKPQQENLPLPVVEGVHLNMPDTVYFDARAIGSTDLKQLYWDATSWWAQSDHNHNKLAPRRIARRTGKDLGSALHVLVIQGEPAYAAQFAIEPDDGRSDWAKGRDGIRRILAEKGVSIPRGDFTDKTLWRLVRTHGLAHKVFEIARADYEAARRGGLQHLTEDEDRRLRYTAGLIRQHPQLGPALTGGLGEVAVFWRRKDDPRTLLRAKFDYIRVRRMFDLKSIGNARGRDIDTAIRQAIEDYDYDIQRRLYPEAFEALVEFVRAGRVYSWGKDGLSAEVLHSERALLDKIAAGGTPQWVWIFVQIRDDQVGKERGTVIAARSHRPEGRIWDEAGIKVETALKTYRDFRDRFSLDRPWALIDEDVRELVDGDVRSRLKREMA